MLKMIFAFIFLSLSVFAQSDLTVVAVGEAELDRGKIVIFNPKVNGKNQGIATHVIEVLRNDFSFYRTTFTTLKNNEHGFDINPDDLLKEKNNFALFTMVEESKGKMIFKFKLYNVLKKADVVNLTKELSSQDVRAFTHDVADELFQAITGKKSVFKSKIVFTSDKGAVAKRYYKELYMMDFDGENVQKLTNHQGIVISPSFSYDNQQIAYSLIENTKGERNITLRIYDLKTRQSRMVSNLKGINSGAVFTPDGSKLILTLSFSGNSEIYKMDLEGKNLVKVTNHSSDDVDPSLNRDGTRMSFLSDRSGKAMIYTMNPESTEKDVKRISFIGKFNATPNFSPDGKSIVFSSFDRAFDIYRISADGDEIVRLTKDFGSNEDPNYSNDGEFILFSSVRFKERGTKDIYIMDKDGEILGAINKGFGNCSTPRWSK
jgi:TolB protein